ncbi:MAG: 30S ribosomal protein S16 [Gammaproteobacteria bacterium]|nr:30S ribosomal protein S16 [Gammaproteobacteria bacterium]
MVKIRLARGGAKKKPFYSIVATDSRKRRDSGYIERIGYFNPVAQGQEIRLQLEEDRLEYWVSQGAQISDRVKQLAREYKDPSIREKYLVAKEAKIAAVEKAKSEAEAAAKAEAEAAAKAEAEAQKEQAAVEEAPAEEAPAEEAPAEEAPAEEAPVEAAAEEAPAEEPEAEEKDSK